MATYTVIVDDRDPGIIYSPQTVGSGGSQLDGWLQTTAASYSYLGTVTRSGLNGSTLTYSFLGTSISVWAIVNGSKPNTDIAYTLDGSGSTSHTIESGSLGVVLGHQNIFTIDSLTGANHTIEITILTQTDNTNFEFDYFLVEAPSNSSMETSPTSVLFIDDTSSYLNYSSQADWTNTTPSFNAPQVNLVMNGSSKGTLAAGATVSFAFTGWAIIVYGIGVDNATPIATYTLDGHTADSVHVPTYSGATPNFAFISEVFPQNAGEQEHVLEIIASSSDHFYLDYITVQSSKAYVPTLGATTQSNGSTSSTSTTTSTATSTASGHTSHVVAIAGSVVSATLLIIALVSISVCIWRRRSSVRRQKALRDTIDPMLLVNRSQERNMNQASSETITPFILPPSSAMLLDPKPTTATRALPIGLSQHTLTLPAPTRIDVPESSVIDISPFGIVPPPSYATAASP